MSPDDGSKPTPRRVVRVPPRTAPSASEPPKLPPIPPIGTKAAGVPSARSVVAVNPLASVADDDLDGLVDVSLSETVEKPR
jgi:hypothetical protein